MWNKSTEIKRKQAAQIKPKGKGYYMSIGYCVEVVLLVSVYGMLIN